MKPTERSLDGSLEQCKDELRDAYMNFKDLQTRCIIDIRSNSIEGFNDTQQVFYHKPDTFMLDDLDKQRQYRETLLKSIGTLPKPEKELNLEQHFNSKFQGKISAQQTPPLTRQMLANYYKRRQYSLQHLKYKLLCRWAHHTLTSDRIETIGSEATYLLGKLEMSLENAMQRSERLSQNDYFASMRPQDRPSALAKEGSPLYVENSDIPQQSLIREDDVEVYIRGTTYRNKVNKTFNKFYARVKHLKMLKHDSIFEQAVEEYFNQKNSNIAKQKEVYQSVRHHVQQHNVMTQELKQELDQISKQYYCQTYDSLFADSVEKWKYGWKPNHDEVPRLVDDTYLLKNRMSALGEKFGITGDIEIDQGYSYSYQITVFFPHCFQRQLLKSQFSIYDSFQQDIKLSDKASLSKMPQIDTNIFRDVSTLKNQIPSMESVHQEFRSENVRILRLKSANSWVSYVTLHAILPDWQTEQQAILSTATTDALLKTTIQLLDMNDQYHAMKSMEESAYKHKDNTTKLLQRNLHNQVTKIHVQTPDGDRELIVDLLQYNNTNSKLPHLHDAVNGKVKTPRESHDNDQQSVLRNLPRVVLTAYYQLRFLSMREHRIKIMYCLNYYRAIQKRLALDLREFGTRDRVDGIVANPLVQAKEATSNVANQVNLQKKIHDSYMLKQKSSRILASVYQPKMTVFEDDTIANMRDMASLRFYKANGVFNNQVMTTNPIMPKCHAASEEPLTYQSSDEGKTRSVTDASVKLISRIDFIELDETLEEVYVKDDYGIYVLFDCVLQDMKSYEDQLLQLGSFYLNKSEVLLDPVQEPVPWRDRHQVLSDLLSLEAKFQFKKVRLIQVYMECYEHISCPLEQQRLMQTITNLMALKVRVNLQANYFEDAYQAELKCLDVQFDLVRQVVDLQISLEKAENKRIQDSLGLSFTLANSLQKNRFKYEDVNKLLQALVPKQSKLETKEAVVTAVNVDVAKHESKVKPAKPSEVHFNDGLSDSSEEVSELQFEGKVGDDQENIFVQLLGLPQITIETIYQNYREQNMNVINIMQEHNNFITCFEGYPQFITRLAEDSILPNNKVFKLNPWSQDTGCLDFYETLSIINRLHRVQCKLQSQLYENLWDPQLMIYIDIQVALQMLDQLRTVMKIQEGALPEYDGRALVEDEQVMGCADKIIFIVKEMVSSFRSTPVNLQDPFVIAKLDPSQISLYSFVKQEASLNKYQLRNKAYSITCDKQYLVNLANQRTPKNLQEKVQNLLSSQILRQRIKAPSLLQLYCNLIELVRMRQEIVKTTTEVGILTEVYRKQAELIGSVGAKVEFDQGIQFNTDPSTGFVNFVEDGPSHMSKIGLAIQEFDNTLLSNFNFRNPDTLKLNVLESGLQETRMILSYQVMQKYLLLLATRQNHLLVQNYVRSISELKLFLVVQRCLPNSIEDYKQFFSRSFDGISKIRTCNDVLQNKADHSFVIKVLKKIKSVQSQLSLICSPQFCQVLAYKVQSRSQLQQEYQGRKVQVQKMYSCQVQVDSVLRKFRTELVNRFITNTVQKVCQDFNRLQSIKACNHLRVLNRLIQFYKYETCLFLDNYTVNYQQTKPKEFSTDKVKEGIPSTVTLIAQDYDIKYQVQVKLLQVLWFIHSLTLPADQFIMVTTSIMNGMPFEKDDEFDRRRKQVVNLPEQSPDVTKAIKSVNSLLQQLDDKPTEYLQSFIEFQFQLILCTLFQCQERFYQQQNDHAVSQVHHAITQLYSKETKQSFVQQWEQSVQPVISSQRLEPKQLELLKSQPLIQNQFQRFNLCLIGMDQQSRLEVYNQLMLVQSTCYDVLAHVHNEQPQDVLTMQEIELCKKYVKQTASAQIYKFKLLTWIHGKPMPYQSDVFNKLDRTFKDKYLWKVLEQKQMFGIDELQDHQIQQDATKQVVKVTKSLYAVSKAEMIVYRDEIDKLLVQAAVRCLDSETHALAKCFTLSVPSIQFYIHPFQQFAATMFDQCDPHSNQDMSNKFAQVQSFLTKIRNRSTQIETLTSGPGLMITIKDLNEILIEFCRKQIVDQQLELKSRNETQSLINGQYAELCYLKDQQLKSQQQRLDYIDQNLDGIISAMLFEKGNRLVYELDNSNRILEVFKKHYSGMEQRITQRVQADQAQKFNMILDQNEQHKLKFNDYKQTIWNFINQDFAEEQEKVKAQLRNMAEMAKRTDLEPRPSNYYPASGQVYQKGGNLLAGAVVPDKFTHYSNCYCYVPNPKYPRPTMELAELELLSEYEARQELASLCIAMRKQRILYRTKEVCLKNKYEEKIRFLETQQNSNKLLWDQLQSSDHREKVIKQELALTQTKLSSAEKKIDDLQNLIKRLEADKCRLQKNNLSKVDRLHHLEQKVKDMDVFEIIDQDKLVTALIQTDKKLQDMQKNNVEVVQVTTDKYKQMFIQEQQRNRLLQQQIDQFKLEFQMIEGNDLAKKLLGLCRNLKSDNESLTQQCARLMEEQDVSLPQIKRKSVVEEHVPLQGVLHCADWRSGKRRQSKSTLALDSSLLTKAASKTARKSRQHMDSIFNSHQTLSQTEAINQLKASSRYRLA